MSHVSHLSMRVPWRDRAWDQFVCDDPLGNSSCTLLANIGANRDDEFETAEAGRSISELDANRLPCLSERATFMSPSGYKVTKHHPYSTNKVLKGKLHPTEVEVPGFAFEAIPYRWLNRKTLADIDSSHISGFNQAAEDRIDAVLNFGPAWVMDSLNQRAILESFFEPVQPADSIVFVYLKHSPLQEDRTDKLIAGAALVSRVTPPPMWRQSGNPPFSSSMWETVVEHSLRPDMKQGVLLPYQDLIPRLDDGVDINEALAWAPEGRDVEFSYVTEHMSDDAAIEALGSLRNAANRMVELGIEIPGSAIEWIDDQTERLWQLRGPAPGLSGALSLIGVQRPGAAARAVLGETGEGQDPWTVLEDAFADPTRAPQPVKQHLTRVQSSIWQKLGTERQAVVRLLSGFDISIDQAAMLFEGNTAVECEAVDLLENPYYAAVCTYGMPEHIPFTTIDRAMFPPKFVAWETPSLDIVNLDGHLDRRRIEALLTEVLERAGTRGDTVMMFGEALESANSVALSQPPNLTMPIINGLDLDGESLAAADEWAPLTSGQAADGKPTLKLARFHDTSEVIRGWIKTQRNKPSLGKIVDSRAVLDGALDANTEVKAPTESDHELEEKARSEKAAGLSALHDSPLSVLIGPAGTGKTTLLRALVDYPGVDKGDVLLLAPTGKARVQLETKVGRPAKTLAAHLVRSDRYEGTTGIYRTWGAYQRSSHGLVIVDEASMLTEEMLAALLDSFSSVKRMILVGDPRQLPPIGAGRPFVDLVHQLTPESFDEWVRVETGFVELQVPRRQLPDGSQGRRHDLELAAWFGGSIRGAGDDDIWDHLASRADLPTLRYVQWGDRTAVEALTDEVAKMYSLDSAEDRERAFALTYGATEFQQYLNWEPGAGKKADNWQILSPTRSRAFGTVELNRHIKRTYRQSETNWARGTFASNIPKPIGPEQIVRGDKVMQTKNRSLGAWPKEGALNYVANGEIGVGIGRVTPSKKLHKSKLGLQVEFSSQPGFSYSYWPTDSDDALLELAWAVTVHKSQGSEFETTFVILPKRANVSRELMYTALTRQRGKVVIIHEGDVSDLRDLTAPWRSDTASRLTDLFDPPQPVTLEVRGEKRRFDRKLIHVSASGIPMASKNEVIIAGLLDQLAPGSWMYEKPLIGSDGRTVRPDFTIARGDGQTVFWEHAGMLDLPDYARKWDLKKDWYVENNILPAEVGGGTNGTLMWTDDLAGADAQRWLAEAADVLGVVSIESKGARGQKIAAKKVASKKKR